jgi:hypothetical protein
LSIFEAHLHTVVETDVAKGKSVDIGSVGEGELCLKKEEDEERWVKERKAIPSMAVADVPH